LLDVRQAAAAVGLIEGVRCYKTQWTAQFYAAAELTSRRYLVSLTFGNVPVADLLVQSPKGQTFTVDVRGQSTRNFWLVQRRNADAHYYFVLVYLTPEFEPPRFFVLTSDQLMKHRREYENASKKRRKYNDALGGMNWSTAMQHEDKWAVLPK
jgi:hypothetical protein